MKYSNLYRNNKTQPQIPIEQPQTPIEEPELPSQPQTPIEQPQIQDDKEVELAEEPEFKPLIPKGLIKNSYNKFLNDVNESGLACKKKNC